MDIDIITKLISTVGFPIGVAAWFMLKSDATQKKLAESYDRLTVAHETLTATIVKTDENHTKCHNDLRDAILRLATTVHPV